jgi:hypothetical protein
VNFTGAPRHTQIITVFRCRTWDDTLIYSDYVVCSDVTVSAVQEATSTKSYGNFGLGVWLVVKGFKPSPITTGMATASTPPAERGGAV